jgi:NAD-reducing hydrogenase small subunit
MAKPRIATAHLAGCFGCHMSVLDIDERILQLVDLVEFDRSPINDIKEVGSCDVGLIEGGCANEDNVHVLQAFRKNCNILVSVGACAINGNIPALRNGIPVRECLEEAFLHGPTVQGEKIRGIPDDPEVPLLLNKVYPCHEVVKIDYFLPGCPPPADLIWEALVALVEGREPEIPEELLIYD